MKKIILSLLFSLFLSFGFSQNLTFNFPSNGSYAWQNSVGAGSVSYCGTSGLFMGVSRSQYTNKYGSYEYTIFVASNSYSSQAEGCYLGYTYADEINIYCWNTVTNHWEFPLYFSPLWVNVGNSAPLYKLYSSNPLLYIRVIVGNYQLSK
jgi:hypothetical protein